MIDIREQLIKVLGTAKLHAGSDRLADELIEKLTKRGIAIVDSLDVVEPPDEHLRIMKQMRKRLSDVVNDPDCPPRDLASLSRRLTETQRDISTLEERIREENKRTGASTRKAKATDEQFDAANI